MCCPRAKRRIAAARVAFETPGAVDRAERLAAVAAMIYLLFNEGHSASGGDAHIRVPLCAEAIRLARLLGDPEIMGLAPLLLQHAPAHLPGSMPRAASCCSRIRIAPCGTAR
jgi:RNA polymerase sigma-70 factor, ECF subfamily